MGLVDVVEVTGHPELRCGEVKMALETPTRMIPGVDAIEFRARRGPQDAGAMDSRVRLVTEVRKQCEQAGVGWTIWEDPKDMKLLDSASGTWVGSIVDALLP